MINPLFLDRYSNRFCVNGESYHFDWMDFFFNILDKCLLMFLHILWFDLLLLMLLLSLFDFVFFFGVQVIILSTFISKLGWLMIANFLKDQELLVRFVNFMFFLCCYKKVEIFSGKNKNQLLLNHSIKYNEINWTLELLFNTYVFFLNSDFFKWIDYWARQCSPISFFSILYHIFLII